MKLNWKYLPLAAILLTSCHKKTIYENEAYCLTENAVLQDGFTAKAVSNFEITSNYQSPNETSSETLKWKLKNDISSYGNYQSPYQIETAIYNMGVDEMINAIEPDSTWRTGKEWAGVWTRDISYSTILSLAQMQPRVCKISLLKKVNEAGIIQDTGTGGAWPISSDRLIWASAAWQVYLTTGDQTWLETIYPIIKRSLNRDLHTIINYQSKLRKGESSFIDWREQSYPKWMQPADIFESQCLGTNAMYVNAYKVASQMATQLGDQVYAHQYEELAKELSIAINKELWLQNYGYYSSFKYGRDFFTPTHKSETLGESWIILSDIASTKRAEKITESLPFTPYGPTIFYPQIPNIQPYHNDGIWPFVSAYWALANAKVGNEQGVTQTIASIYRAAALFATNKENYVAQTGDHKGTAINSSNMLWSLAGNIAMVQRIFLGMHFTTNGLIFNPFVPKAFQGERHLSNFKYRNMTLDITVKGYGDEINKCTIDGEHEIYAFINGNLTGHHTIEIELTNHFSKTLKVNNQANLYAPETPQVNYKDSLLTWDSIPGATDYLVLYNGKRFGTIKTVKCQITGPGNYQVIAFNPYAESFASEPITVFPTQIIPVKGNKGKIINQKENTTLSFNCKVKNAGNYSVDFNYANGHGPINTENKCCIRTLYVDGKIINTIVFPQRGTEAWDNWGWSSSQIVKLQKGKHLIEVKYQPWNQNMNINTNEAIIRSLRLKYIPQTN